MHGMHSWLQHSWGVVSPFGHSRPHCRWGVHGDLPLFSPIFALLRRASLSFAGGSASLPRSLWAPFGLPHMREFTSACAACHGVTLICGGSDDTHQRTFPLWNAGEATWEPPPWQLAIGHIREVPLWLWSQRVPLPSAPKQIRSLVSWRGIYSQAHMDLIQILCSDYSGQT